MQSLYIREFGRIVRGEENQQHDDIDKIILNKNAWDFLANRANSNKKNDRFIKIVNLTSLKVQNFVGVITTSDGTQIEILPKINETADANSAQQSRLTLMRMLKVVHNLPFIETTEANLENANQALPEVLIGWFLDAAYKIIKQGIRRDYLRISAHEKFLKGQLQTHRQLNEPPHKQHLFHIEYDILSPNRAENRLIYSALLQVLMWSKDFNNQKMARHFLMILDEVPESKNISDDFEKWSSGRDMNYYQPVLPWLKLILNQQSPFALKDKNAGISFLLPMEKLFEKYVAKMLTKILPSGYKLTEQKPQKPLATFKSKKVFTMKPDIVISDNNKKPICILDTKWKLIDENRTYENGNINNKKGINQADMYQLFAYGKKYDKVVKVVLIYPEWNKFENKFDFQFDENLRLDVVPFSLDNKVKMSDFECTKTS